MIATHTAIDFDLPKSDCIYHSPIDLEPNGILFDCINHSSIDHRCVHHSSIDLEPNGRPLVDTILVLTAL